MSASVQFQALEAIRAVVKAMPDLWPVAWDNYVPQPEPTAGAHRITESYLGGRQRDAAAGFTPRWLRYVEQVTYELGALPDEGVKATQDMADAIARAVRGTLLYLADGTTPVVITATDVSPPVVDGPWIARSLTFTYEFTTT